MAAIKGKADALNQSWNTSAKNVGTLGAAFGGLAGAGGKLGSVFAAIAGASDRANGSWKSFAANIAGGAALAGVGVAIGALVAEMGRFNKALKELDATSKEYTLADFFKGTLPTDADYVDMLEAAKKRDRAAAAVSRKSNLMASLTPKSIAETTYDRMSSTYGALGFSGEQFRAAVKKAQDEADEYKRIQKEKGDALEASFKREDELRKKAAIARAAGSPNLAAEKAIAAGAFDDQTFAVIEGKEKRARAIRKEIEQLRGKLTSSGQAMPQFATAAVAGTQDAFRAIAAFRRQGTTSTVEDRQLAEMKLQTDALKKIEADIGYSTAETELVAI